MNDSDFSVAGENPEPEDETLEPERGKNDAPFRVRVADDLPEICVPDEVAQFFRVERRQVLAWCRDKESFPHARKMQGNKWRIPKGDVLALAERLFG